MTLTRLKWFVRLGSAVVNVDGWVARHHKAGTLKTNDPMCLNILKAELQRRGNARGIAREIGDGNGQVARGGDRDK
jgi:hypothetical protein